MEHKRTKTLAQEELVVLQTQCGLGASLSSVVRRIWLANLAESSILTQNFSRCEDCRQASCVQLLQFAKTLQWI